MELSIRYEKTLHPLILKEDNVYRTDDILLDYGRPTTFEIMRQMESTGVFISIDTSEDIFQNILYSERFKKDDWNFIKMYKTGERTIQFEISIQNTKNRYAVISNKDIVWSPDVSEIYTSITIDDIPVGIKNPFIPITSIRIINEWNNVDQIIYGPFKTIEFQNIEEKPILPEDSKKFYSIIRINGIILGDPDKYIPITSIRFISEEDILDKVINGPFEAIKFVNIS